MSDLDKRQPLATFFDYESLEQAHRLVVQEHTGEIRKRLRRSAQDVWEIGQRLADVRSRLKYGQFLVWLNAEFGWSQRTAYNFINVYETFGDRFAKLAKVDIATSVLYKLAAPSVPDELRTQVLDAAEEGEKITHKSVTSAIKQIKKSKHSPATPAQPSLLPESKAKKPEIITVIPKSAGPVGRTAEEQPPTDLEIMPGWHRLGNQHYLFCGDTASASFVKTAPPAKLAIAATTEDWAHDWLVEQADSVVILPEEDASLATINELLKLLSKPGDTVIFPWLPFPEMIVVADRLNRVIYAGDPSVGRCQQAAIATNLKLEALANQPAMTLAC
jgi:hypothetical protein